VVDDICELDASFPFFGTDTAGAVAVVAEVGTLAPEPELEALGTSEDCCDFKTSLAAPSLNFRKRRRSASTFSAALANASRGNGFILSGKGSSNASKFSSPSSSDPLAPSMAESSGFGGSCAVGNDQPPRDPSTVEGMSHPPSFPPPPDTVAFAFRLQSPCAPPPAPAAPLFPPPLPPLPPPLPPSL
jgi:hypothetical protein